MNPNTQHTERRISDTNLINLTGRLVEDGKLNKTTNGTSYLTFTIASNRYFEGANGPEKRTEFVDIIIWGKRAETHADDATKGRPVAIMGELNINTIESESGNRRVARVKAQYAMFL